MTKMKRNATFVIRKDSISTLLEYSLIADKDSMVRREDVEIVDKDSLAARKIVNQCGRLSPSGRPPQSLVTRWLFDVRRQVNESAAGSVAVPSLNFR